MGWDRRRIAPSRSYGRCRRAGYAGSAPTPRNRPAAAAEGTEEVLELCQELLVRSGVVVDLLEAVGAGTAGGVVLGCPLGSAATSCFWLGAGGRIATASPCSRGSVSALTHDAT